MSYNAFTSIVFKYTGYNRFTDRLNEIGMLIFKGDGLVKEFSGSARIRLYLVSLDTWRSSVKHFFFGVGYPDLNIRDNFSLVGGHSDFIDSLAKYGIVGEVLLIICFVSFFLSLYKMITVKDKYIVIVYGIMLGIYGVLSGFLEAPAIGISMFFILPMGLVVHDYDKKSSSIL